MSSWYDCTDRKNGCCHGDSKAECGYDMGMQSENGFSDIAILDGRQDHNRYTSSLENFLVPHIIGKHPYGFIFQQGYASIHTGVTTKKWINEKKVNLKPWPVKSPNLNSDETPGALFLDMLMKMGGNSALLQT